MQALILAGGLGTRLWPLTKEVPKPMVPVAGVPYLEHQLRLLARQGLQDVVMLTANLSEQIEEYFGDGRRLGLDIRYSREPEPLGTGGALRAARHLRSVLALIPPEGKVSLEQQVFPLLIDRGMLLGLPTQQRFYDIGTAERLKSIEELLA